MAKIVANKLKVEPEFDVMYYMELNGSTRIDHSLLTKLEGFWNDWVNEVSAYKLAPNEGRDAAGYLLLFLGEKVEQDVEEVWQNSPSDGFAVHNLAICLAMTCAASHVPDLVAGGCAPLPTPSRDVKKAFEKLGLEWKEEGSVNRQYAVFTHLPYRGGCGICHLKENCPKRIMEGS